jgi:hypothetical protein
MSKIYEEIKTLKQLFIVFKKLKKSPLSPKELEKEVNKEIEISRKQLFRILSLLKEMRLIKQDGDKYHYFEPWQVFKNRDEYEIKLKHSKILLEPLIISNFRSADIYDKNLLQHLKTGYLEIYRKYEEWKSYKGKYIKSKKKFNKKIEREAYRNGFEIIKYEKMINKGKQLSDSLYELIEGYILHKDYKEENIVYRNGCVCDEYMGVVLAKNQEFIKDIRIMISTLLSSNEIKQAFKEMKKLKKQKDEADINYLKDITRLALEVKHGEPLKGYCPLCPKVTIGRQ